MSKYEKLWKYLKDNNENTYELSFDIIKKIIGFDIDHSFLTYKKELIDYEYEVIKIFLKDKKILFKRIQK